MNGRIINERINNDLISAVVNIHCEINYPNYIQTKRIAHFLTTRIARSSWEERAILFYYIYIRKSLLTYFLFAINSITPSTIPNIDDISTWNSAGIKYIMVCAGIQKNGIVFIKTNCHCTFQLKF